MSFNCCYVSVCSLNSRGTEKLVNSHNNCKTFGKFIDFQKKKVQKLSLFVALGYPFQW